jgi:hypothetical protein
MIRKSLIALATVSALAIGFGASSAKADSFDIGLGFGSGGITSGSFGIHSGYGGYGYGHGYGHGYYDAGYDDGDCGYQIVEKKVWNAWHTRKIWVAKKVWTCY